MSNSHNNNFPSLPRSRDFGSIAWFCCYHAPEILGASRGQKLKPLLPISI
ncbi:hypothetical protein [Aequorivita echinoideorum]|uniref:Uncharacterized protein n=1 Tax=Aequorivita echinoideorum TaxID=1549647 RepID=A0ABS5S6S6_9FLAO|nr:hypothetical protein [Aequorivita echinoideorum]MBT0607555.1 hypothetical protein [Aequorivita echinoideorum]